MPPSRPKPTSKEKYALNHESLNAEFYQNVLNSMEDSAVLTLDKEGYINSWNDGAQNLLGYTADESIGQYFGVIFTSEDLKAGAEKGEIKTALQKGRAVDERYHVRKDKSHFWAIGMLFPLLDEQKNQIGFTKVMRNISEKKLAEEQTNEAKLYAESIVETAREPMVVLNEDMSVNTANDAFYKFFQFKKKELSAKLIYELFREQLNIEELKELLNKINADKSGVKDHEITYDFKFTGKRTVVFNGRKILHPALHVNMILLSMEDVTEKRSLEQQKDDFISIASHEIRTPITVIKALAQMLEKRSPKFGDESFTKSLGKINEKTDKLMSLINYLLDITQVKTGELQVIKANFDLEQLVAESIDEMRIIDTRHEFLLKGSFKDAVFADRFRISQVLNNLLNNAIKYSAENTQIITRMTKNRTGDQVTISVQDFGMGIPEEEQNNMFKRFSRSSNVKRKNIAGMGLGLHISREIIKQHNGKIWFKSGVDGSTFYFRIPVIEG